MHHPVSGQPSGFDEVAECFKGESHSKDKGGEIQQVLEALLKQENILVTSRPHYAGAEELKIDEKIPGHRKLEVTGCRQEDIEKGLTPIPLIAIPGMALAMLQTELVAA